MLTSLTWCALTSLRNCEYVRLSFGTVLLCTFGRTSHSTNDSPIATGHSQWRHAGGGGGAVGVGRSPGGGVAACLVIELLDCGPVPAGRWVGARLIGLESRSLRVVRPVRPRRDQSGLSWR